MGRDMLQNYEEPVEMMIELVKRDQSDMRRREEWLSELASVCGVQGTAEEKRKGILQKCREWVETEKETKNVLQRWTSLMDDLESCL